MKNRLLIVIGSLCLIVGCEKVSREFSIESIDMDTYQRITDTLVLRKLAYDNPTISGINDYLSWVKKGERENDTEYETRRSYQKERFDDLFWERINRDSLIQISKDVKRPIEEFFFTRDSMTYRIIDTLSLKPYYGILIYLNSENRIFKKLYLSIYNSKKELEKTFLVAVKYEQSMKGEKGYTEKVSSHSTLSSFNRLNIYTTEENIDYQIGKKDEIHSVYNLNKLELIKSDTVTTGAYPVLDTGGKYLWR